MFSCDIEKMLNKYLWTMKQNCFRLLRLVNNLIDLSKVESGYLRLDMRNYDIVKIIEDITLSVVHYAETNDMELIFDTDVEEKIMYFDVDKIERIMLNLLSNAIKFSSPGGKILVTVSLMEDSIKVSVKDTGVGIPPDKLDLIFDRFAQVDKTLSRNYEGSGIGLALVKSLIALHDGAITVSSVLGEGSEFTIELPIKLAEIEETNEHLPYQSNVERIHIEFSDIYS
jgi:signal transduction histidine kinase